VKFATLRAMLADDGGATLVEYGVLLALLSLIGLAGLEATASQAGNAINDQQTNFGTVQTAP
jgi:Flp pilus assembly pilin Flp